MRSRRTFVTLLFLLLSTGELRAQSQEAQARAHYAAGQAHYAAARWREALVEFELGYTLAPRPEFLVNFAQVHRKLGRYDEALAECERYLATSPPPHVADEARRLMALIREERARATIAPAPVRPPEIAAPAPERAPILTQARQDPPPARPRRPRWVWAVVGVSAAVVAGAAIGLGVGLSSPRVTYPDASLGRYDFR